MNKTLKIIKKEISWIKGLILLGATIVGFIMGIFFEQHMISNDIKYINDKLWYIEQWISKSTF